MSAGLDFQSTGKRSAEQLGLLISSLKKSPAGPRSPAFCVNVPATVCFNFAVFFIFVCFFSSLYPYLFVRGCAQGRPLSFVSAAHKTHCHDWLATLQTHYRLADRAGRSVLLRCVRLLFARHFQAQETLNAVVSLLTPFLSASRSRSHEYGFALSPTPTYWWWSLRSIRGIIIHNMGLICGVARPHCLSGSSLF